MALGTKANQFACKTEVKDHLMRKREDEDLDEIFEGEPNIGEEISEAPKIVSQCLFSQSHELINADIRNSLNMRKHNQLTKKTSQKSHLAK